MEDRTCNHTSCSNSTIKGLIHGLYYGGRVRFMHSMVMTLLFRKQSFDEIINSILKPTYEHSWNLGMFVCLYKALVCLLNNAAKKNRKEHSLIAGGIVGYLIFKEKTAVNNQIILYLLSRNLVGFFNNL